MKTKTLDKQIIVHINEKMLCNFKQICDKNYKNMSEVIRDLILRYIKDN